MQNTKNTNLIFIALNAIICINADWLIIKAISFAVICIALYNLRRC